MGPAPATTLITAARPGIRQSVLELARYRELLWALVSRQLTIRYRQTIVGAAWVVFQPLAMMAVFTLVFGLFARMPTGNVPYHVFVLCGFIHWQLFSRCVGEGANVMVTEQAILARVYFPRVLAPLAFFLAALFDFLLMCALYLVYLALFHPGSITLGLLALPFYWLLLAMLSLGAMLFTGAANVRYRDVTVVIPFLVFLLMFLAPVVYPESVWPARFAPYLSLNPLAGVILGVHWCLFAGAPFPLLPTLSALICSVAVLGLGFAYFIGTSRNFGDYLR
jgi:lipopolysaccharide transport system permease protein